MILKFSSIEAYFKKLPRSQNLKGLTTLLKEIKKRAVLIVHLNMLTKSCPFSRKLWKEIYF
jgi:predicted transcriptional regulator YheO